MKRKFPLTQNFTSSLVKLPMENPVNGANDHDVEVEPNGEDDGAVDVDAQVSLFLLLV